MFQHNLLHSQELTSVPSSPFSAAKESKSSIKRHHDVAEIHIGLRSQALLSREQPLNGEPQQHQDSIRITSSRSIHQLKPKMGIPCPNPIDYWAWQLWVFTGSQPEQERVSEIRQVSRYVPRITEYDTTIKTVNSHASHRCGRSSEESMSKPDSLIRTKSALFRYTREDRSG